MMKIFKILGFFGLFLVFTACGSGDPSFLVRKSTPTWIEPEAILEFASRDVLTSSSDSLEFIWQEVAINTKPIEQFFDQDENNIIQTIRGDRGLKVLIVPGPKDGKLNEKLTIGNMKEDESLVQYYLDDPNDQISVATEKEEGSALAQYLPKDFHLHGTSRELLHRPGQDYPMMVITKNSTKREIIHEYMHHYLECREGVKTISKDGVNHSPQCVRFLDAKELGLKLIQVVKDLNEKEEALQYIFIGPLRTELEKEIKELEKQQWSLVGHLISARLGMLNEHNGEEMDIHRYTYRHSQDFQMKEDVSGNLNDIYNMADYFNEIFDVVYKGGKKDEEGNPTFGLRNAILFFKEQDLYKKDHELHVLYDDVLKEFRKLDQKMLKTFLWLESRKPTES